MRLTEITYDSAQPVESYGPGYFRIGGQVLHGPTIITPWDAGPWGGLEDHAALLALADRIDVIFLGMGAEIAHPPRALREALEQAGMGVEVCASPAACRTYNVLLSEGRRVALALLPV
ncbi:Mth938-like domain-containing protein [Gemmobacter denitrificans]|uniref:Mth938-like domain-containing protein n=1 Tax=Gemmobacter denitrificans TaxID=3123040 RepID=A0ABU8BYD5_9RHOB